MPWIFSTIRTWFDGKNNNDPISNYINWRFCFAFCFNKKNTYWMVRQVWDHVAIEYVSVLPYQLVHPATERKWKRNIFFFFNNFQIKIFEQKKNEHTYFESDGIEHGNYISFSWSNVSAREIRFMWKNLLNTGHTSSWYMINKSVMFYRWQCRYFLKNCDSLHVFFFKFKTTTNGNEIKAQAMKGNVFLSVHGLYN